MATLTLFFAFIAGLVSFLSPCVLPLIPAYMTFLAKTSIDEVEKNSSNARSKIFLSSVFFVLGFSVVFSIVGVLLQSVLSNIAYDVQVYLGYFGGIILILFGLMLLGLFRISFLERDHKILLVNMNPSYFSSFIFGAAFAVGWTPCVGAILGGILTLAITDPAGAFPLMLSYSLGLGIPFLLVGLFISHSASFIKKIGPYLKWLNIIFAVILIILGILVFTGKLSSIANFSLLNDYLLK